MMGKTTRQQLQRIEDSITALEVHVDLLHDMAGLDDETLDAIEKRCGVLGRRLISLEYGQWEWVTPEAWRNVLWPASKQDEEEMD